MRPRLSTSLLFAATFAPATVFASGSFPSVIRTNLGLDYTPPCSLCHVNNNPGSTAWTPFVISMRSLGATGGNANLLVQAMARADDLHIDSDGDGVTDIDELRGDSDPNSLADVSLSGTTAGHGCNGAHPTGHNRRGGGVAAALLLGTLPLRRRLRARRR